VFRPDDESAGRLKVFHQLDALSIASDATRDAMVAALRSVVEAVLGKVELRFAPEDYPCFKHGTCVTVRTGQRSTQIAGAGMIPARQLRDSGFDPRSVGGFAFGLGLERLAMVKYGIEDIRTLWQPPYVPDSRARQAR
jgi:phenylalanyl-tRNA synthetase alpha chain